MKKLLVLLTLLVSLPSFANLMELATDNTVAEFITEVETRWVTHPEALEELLNDPYRSTLLDILISFSASQQSRSGVLLDHASGVDLTRFGKLTLVKYLVSKGANINLKSRNRLFNYSFSTPAHGTSDPVIMHTLLELGADPTIKAGENSLGHEPLVSFLVGYKRYENKDYFLYVVEKMLKAGASIESCYTDRSGCIKDQAKSIGDPKLTKLINSYSEQ